MARNGRNHRFKPLVLDWNGLVRLGWPFCREETINPKRNNGRYPQSFTLGTHLNARRLWRVKDVLDYFESYGIKVTEDWYAPDEGDDPLDGEDDTKN